MLELLEGFTLRSHIRARGALSASEAVTVLRPIMEVLIEAHAKGIIHCDLKPANIYLQSMPGERLLPKLLDFGIAKVIDGQSSMVTRGGELLGTPEYMSPEQAQGRNNVGPQTDVWAMGIIVFECLTGTVPIRRDCPIATLVAVVNEGAPRLALARPDIDPRVAAVVDRALAGSLSERFVSMEDFGHALCAAVDAPLPVAFMRESVEVPLAAVTIPANFSTPDASPIARVTSQPTHVEVPREAFNAVPFWKNGRGRFYAVLATSLLAMVSVLAVGFSSWPRHEVPPVVEAAPRPAPPRDPSPSTGTAAPVLPEPAATADPSATPIPEMVLEPASSPQDAQPPPTERLSMEPNIADRPRSPHRRPSSSHRDPVVRDNGISSRWD